MRLLPELRSLIPVQYQEENRMRPANAHDTIDAPVSLAAAALFRDQAHEAARDAAGQAARRTIDEIMAEASRRLRRVGPHLAAVELQAGALLVDTRSQAQREARGEVPGALRVERNVLEWRLDPASDYKIPQMTGYHTRVIVMCAEGYSSVLAAVSLQELGLVNATDVIGGFEAWAQAGLPVTGGHRAST
jgi:rhodanese-related sulfurtransferase